MTLITKHRPKTWEEVVGQDASVTAMERLLSSGRSKAFLLSGPSGTGKTTLARIGAKSMKCEITDFPAAKYTGVDDMRTVVDSLYTRPFGKLPNKAIIMDECQKLSKNAWDSLLKAVEEPPSYVYWFFCTTELGKVPAAIKTRCSPIVLKPVSDEELFKYVKEICASDRLKVSDSIIDVVVREAFGSPRQALVNLGLVEGFTDRKDALAALKTAIESEGVISLCKFLMKGGSWSKAMSEVKKLDGENPESIRIVVSAYFAKVAMGAETDTSAAAALNILEAFSGEWSQQDGTASLIRAIGSVLME